MPSQFGAFGDRFVKALWGVLTEPVVVRVLGMVANNPGRLQEHHQGDSAWALRFEVVIFFSNFKTVFGGWHAGLCCMTSDSDTGWMAEYLHGPVPWRPMHKERINIPVPLIFQVRPLIPVSGPYFLFAVSCKGSALLLTCT